MHLLDIRDLDGSTAILGGSFDPLHNGHLHIARQVLYWGRVNKILFVPNGNHHFKQGLVRLSFSDRYALVKSAIAREPHMAVSNADRSGSGYTADLMKSLIKEHPSTRFVFIIGSDNLGNLHNWYNYPWLCKNLHFLVLPRPGYRIDLELLKPLKATILPIEFSPVSATSIRNMLDIGESIKGLVPESLEERIIKLYKANPKKASNAQKPKTIPA